jgi:hypothetical protein
MPFKDPEKQKAYNKEYSRVHYKKNKQKYLAKAVANNSTYKKRNKDFVARYKRWKGCDSCGYSKCIGALEFHHTSSKKDKVARLVNSSVSLRMIKNEIRKCCLLCSNCHREEHERMRRL